MVLTVGGCGSYGTSWGDVDGVYRLMIEAFKGLLRLAERVLDAQSFEADAGAIGGDLPWFAAVADHATVGGAEVDDILVTKTGGFHLFESVSGEIG